MPTYEYECQKCGHRFELFQQITAAPIKECPKCHKDSVRRLISGGAGLIFKGKCENANKRSECSSCPAADPKDD